MLDDFSVKDVTLLVHANPLHVRKLVRRTTPGNIEVGMVLQVLATVVLGLMCGSELNVAALAHPTLNRQPLEVHIPVRASYARLFGKVMPPWMAASTLLNLLLLLPFEHLGVLAGHLAEIAFVIQVAAIAFSLVGPVPINNRIKLWTPTSLPSNWRAQERRWDLYHWIRTSGLIIAFALLVVSALR